MLRYERCSKCGQLRFGGKECDACSPGSWDKARESIKAFCKIEIKTGKVNGTAGKENRVSN